MGERDLKSEKIKHLTGRTVSEKIAYRVNRYWPDNSVTKCYRKAGKMTSAVDAP